MAHDGVDGRRAVRGGGGAAYGRVEVSSDGGASWSAVCDDFFDLGAARVVCRQIGAGISAPDQVVVVRGSAYGRDEYRGRDEAEIRRSNAGGGGGGGDDGGGGGGGGSGLTGIITDDFSDCIGSEESVFSCAKKRKRWKCGDDEQVGVVCRGQD